MSTRETTISVDAWKAELDRVLRESGRHDDGMTVWELAGLWEKSTRVVRERLAMLKREGRLIVGRKRAERVDGQTQTVPCYRIKAKA